MISYLAGIAVILWYILFRYKRRRVYELASRIPTPPGKFPILGALQYYMHGISNNLMNIIKTVTVQAQNNGGVLQLWLGPFFYVGLTNPDDIEFVVKKCLEKADVAKVLRTVIGNAGIFAPVSIWNRRRKHLIPAFSPKIMNSFMDILISHSEDLADQFSQQNVLGGQFTAWPFVATYTLNSVCDTALGIRINNLQNPNNHFVNALAKIFSMTTHRVFRIWLWPDLIYKWTSQAPVFNKYLQTIFDLTDDIIQTKREELKDVDIDLENETIYGNGPQKARCLLEHLILLSNNNAGLNDVELREEVLILLLAGSDTSAIVICNTLTLLAKYPKIQDKVYQEILEVFKDSNYSLKKDDLKEFKYLDRVLKESLRLFPPVPILIRKTTNETILPSGVTLPADTGIIISLWGTSRDKKYWGPDADCFDPDRFLPERKTGFFIPFSSGPRNCIGYRYAITTTKLALISIIRRYKVVGQEESGPVPHIDTKFTFLMRAKDDYQLAFEMR